MLMAHLSDRTPPPYRILMILDGAFPTDVRVENEAKSLVQAGFDVVLLILAPDSRRKMETYQGYTIIRRHTHRKIRNWMRGLAGTVPILSWYIAWHIHRISRKWRFHAIHAHDLYMCGGAFLAGKRLGIPVVADLHEVWVSVLQQYAWSTRFPGKMFISIPRWEKLEKKWGQAAEKVIVVTEEMKGRYISLGCSEEDIAVVSNTINTHAFDSYPVEESILQAHRSEFTMVYTGTINPHRGLAFLIDTMPLVLLHCNAHLVIVGEGRIRSELQKQAELLGVADHIIFQGWRPQEEIKSYIMASDLCLIPLVKCEQTDKAAAHKLFHYMYLKRPVIATNCTYMQQVVQQAECGLIVPYGDIQTFSTSILELYRDPVRRRQMGENGHRAVTERYNWEKSSRLLINMYRDMLGSPS